MLKDWVFGGKQTVSLTNKDLWETVPSLTQFRQGIVRLYMKKSGSVSMKLENYHWLMIITSLVFIAFSFYFPLANYDLLPDPVPTHFNFYGEPDDWSKKSIVNVLLGPIILGLCVLFMLGLTFWITKVDDAKKIINLPQHSLEKMTQETAEEVRHLTIHHLIIITLLLSLLVSAITFNQIMVALGQATNLGWSVAILVILLLADSFYMTWKIIRLI